MTSLTDLIPAGAVLHVSAHADNKVLTLAGSGDWLECSLPGARGLAVGADTAIATDDGIVHFDAATGQRTCTTHLPPVQGHELAYAADGKLLLTAATRSTVYKVGLRAELEPVLVAPGTDAGSDDIRSFVNGLCTSGDGHLAYVTALGLSNVADGWRSEAADSRGVLIDAVTGTVALGGLLMPHSPTLHDGAVWLLDSGRGQLLRWTPGTAQAAVVARLTGFARGLLIVGDHALVGVSQGRITSMPSLTTDPLAAPGIAVIDLNSGEQVDFVSLDVTEVFDIDLGTAILAG